MNTSTTAEMASLPPRRSYSEVMAGSSTGGGALCAQPASRTNASIHFLIVPSLSKFLCMCPVTHALDPVAQHARGRILRHRFANVFQVGRQLRAGGVTAARRVVRRLVHHRVERSRQVLPPRRRRAGV